MGLFSSLIQFIRLGRPLFLVGGFLFHGLGVLIALTTGRSLSLPALVWGQVAITAIQLMVHYANEYFDLAADRANPHPTRWAGGSRVLVEGRLSPRVALITAGILAAVALIASFWLALVIGTGPWTLPLLTLAITLAWGYSAPPTRLHSRGIGELTVALLVPGLTPLVGFYLQAGRLAILPLLASVPLCCFQLAMLLSISFPDAVGDAAVGKRTLVVRWGEEKVARLYIATLLTAYALLPLLVVAGLPGPVALVLLVPSPIAIWHLWRMWHGAWAHSSKWESLAFWSIALFMSSGAAEFIAFFWLLYQTSH
jgi:1,4-dihydroxy-2-naphthoate octaprenyltransferase